MVIGMSRRCRGEAVMYRMRSRKPRRFKAESRQESIGLNESFQGWIDYLGLDSAQRIRSIFNEDAIAQFCQHFGAASRSAATHIPDVSLDTGLGFKPGREGIT